MNTTARAVCAIAAFAALGVTACQDAYTDVGSVTEKPAPQVAVTGATGMEMLTFPGEAEMSQLKTSAKPGQP